MQVALDFLHHKIKKDIKSPEKATTRDTTDSEPEMSVGKNR